MDDNNPYRTPISADVSGPTRQKNGLASAVAQTLAVLCIIGILFALMLPAVRTAREPARRSQCMNHLKQIGLALHSYADAHGALPPAYTTDADGAPLHSWRTLILPFMEERELYESIDLTKPWNDPVNAQAAKTQVSVYQCPSVPEIAQPDRLNHTAYLAVVTPDSCFRPADPRTLSEITDGAGNTLAIIEADTQHAVPWMPPVDADETVVMGIGPQSKLPHPDGVNGAFADGSVRFLPADMAAAQRRALISIAGNDKSAAEGDN